MARDDENQQQALGGVQLGAAQTVTGKENPETGAREQTLDELTDLTYSG